MAKARVTIVGLGLIGGSLGLALQKIKKDFEIVGHDKELGIANQARKQGVVDKTDWNLVSACEGADLIILAIPISGIQDTLKAIADWLKPGCIITDTATIKQPVLAWADEILPENVSFIGGDPLVTDEGEGLEDARADLFEGARYCLIPSNKARSEAVRLLADLVSAMGAQPYFIDALEHDGLMAGISHLPFILSTALLGAVSSSAAWRDIQKMAGAEFRRATAYADTDPATYRDICLNNSASIVRWIDECVAQLQTMRQAIEAEDAEEIEKFFETVHTARGEWLSGSAEDRRLSEELDKVTKNRFRSLILGSRF